MSDFWSLVERSVIVQALITLILVSGVTYLYATSQPVPNELYALVTLTLGFYFGAKTENAKMSRLVGKG